MLIHNPVVLEIKCHEYFPRLESRKPRVRFIPFRHSDEVAGLRVHGILMLSIARDYECIYPPSRQLIRVLLRVRSADKPPLRQFDSRRTELPGDPHSAWREVFP